MLDANKLQQAVDQAYTQFHSLNGGQNADYIPFLANVPSQLAAVAIVTCDGNIYRAGDSDYRFALESISKVLFDDIIPTHNFLSLEYFQQTSRSSGYIQIMILLFVS